MRDFAAPMAYSSLFFGTKAVAFANTYVLLCTLRLKRSRHHFFFHARNFFKKSLIV